MARVAPSVRRQLANRGSELLVVLAVGGAKPHEGRDGGKKRAEGDPKRVIGAVRD